MLAHGRTTTAVNERTLATSSLIRNTEWTEESPFASIQLQFAHRSGLPTVRASCRQLYGYGELIRGLVQLTSELPYLSYDTHKQAPIAWPMFHWGCLQQTHQLCKRGFAGVRAALGVSPQGASDALCWALGAMQMSKATVQLCNRSPLSPGADNMLHSCW
jgi:hypothetical protein